MRIYTHNGEGIATASKLYYFTRYVYVLYKYIITDNRNILFFALINAHCKQVSKLDGI